MRHHNLCFAALLLPLIASAQQAMRSAPPPPTGGDLADPRSLRLDLDYFAEMDLDNSQGSYDVFRARIQAPVYEKKSGPWTWGLNIEAEQTAFQVENSPSPLVTDRDLSQLGVNLNLLYRKENSDWRYFFNFRPSLNTDWEGGVSSDALRLRGITGVFYQHSPDLMWAFGLMYQENFDALPVFPFIGFNWQASDDWNFSVLGPRFDARYMPSDDWSIGAFVAGNSRNWNVEANGRSRDFEVNSGRFGIAYNHRVGEKIWLTAESGITYANSLEVLSTGGNSLYEEEADSSFFLSLGFRIPL